MRHECCNGFEALWPMAACRCRTQLAKCERVDCVGVEMRRRLAGVRAGVRCSWLTQVIVFYKGTGWELAACHSTHSPHAAFVTSTPSRLSPANLSLDSKIETLLAVHPIHTLQACLSNRQPRLPVGQVLWSVLLCGYTLWGSGTREASGCVMRVWTCPGDGAFA